MAEYHISMSVRFLGHTESSGFEGNTHDQYEVTFKRPSGIFGGRGAKAVEAKVIFHQSINDSGLCEFSMGPIWDNIRKGKDRDCDANWQTDRLCAIRIPPTSYCVLSCVEKNDPGTFKNFCDGFGLSDDSLKALDLYKRVCEEYQKFVHLSRGDDGFMEKMQEIQ
jgi:hypothetical protein